MKRLFFRIGFALISLSVQTGCVLHPVSLDLLQKETESNHRELLLAWLLLIPEALPVTNSLLLNFTGLIPV